jgi:hypothetical protein
MVLILAYSNFTRAVFASAFHRVASWLVTRFWIYRVWIRFRQRWTSESQWRRTEAYVTWQKTEEGMATRRRLHNELYEEWELKKMRRAMQKEIKLRKQKERARGENGVGSNEAKAEVLVVLPTSGGDSNGGIVSGTGVTGGRTEPREVTPQNVFPVVGHSMAAAEGGGTRRKPGPYAGSWPLRRRDPDLERGGG